MEKIGVADYGMKVWYGNFYDYDERIADIRAIGYDGLERLYPNSAEEPIIAVIVFLSIAADTYFTAIVCLVYDTQVFLNSNIGFTDSIFLQDI